MRPFALILLACAPAFASIFSSIHGVVHDPSHRPVAEAAVTIQGIDSAYNQTAATDPNGEFTFTAVPAGEYKILVERSGFAPEEQALSLVSGTAPVLHFQLALATQSQSTTVEDAAEAVTTESETTVTRSDIENTPGVDQTNSLRLITDFVPGAYVTHDQLHIRGGHQVTWAIDGVPIPNTNIATSVGPQIDPKDIDTLEVDRGGYSSEYGDRTYGVFNVVPRTGFESNKDLDLTTTYGSFNQTDDQLSYGDHTQTFAWFGSINGNRSDYGLETPGPSVDHDRAWGLSGFTSLIYNVDPSNQLRLVATTRGDDYQIPSSYDVERERDDVVAFTWAHTFSPGVLMTISPFFHFNSADYDGAPNAVPVSTVQDHASDYGGAEVALTAAVGAHSLRVGGYGFGQHDSEAISVSGDGASVATSSSLAGALEAGFLEDQWKATSWLTLTGGLRATHFDGEVSESAVDPRVGAAVRIPHLNWVLRGFYGSYYQAPPLETVSGPLLQYASNQGLGIVPLKGERDEENQVGLSIPWHGWTADFDSFRMRATNFFDHSSIGESNVYLPLTIGSARIWGQEVTLRSPRFFHRSNLSVAYSNQHAEGSGAITGGLTDFSPPANGWFLLDHDQRNTFHANFNTTLPGHITASISSYYGSGFTDGSLDYAAHLQGHTTFDAALGRNFGERLYLSLNGLNVGNRRFLLDNSQTFGGTHYAEPREIYIQLRYRLHL